MIDVKHTLLSTINKHIKNLCYRAVNDPMIFKKIIYLIVLDEIYDWSNYLGDSLGVLKKLQELRTSFILNNKEFVIERIADTVTSDLTNEVYVIPELQPYTNVNTPQTSLEWRRVWDAPDLILVTETLTEISQTITGFTPDYSCPQNLIYYPTELYGGISINRETEHYGEPLIQNLANLTTCEKMNIFINREDGSLFYLDPASCTWKKAKSDGELVIYWDDIPDHPHVYEGIHHYLNTSASTVDVLLLVSGDTLSNDIQLATNDEDIGGLL